jgi:hypothetical protein
MEKTRIETVLSKEQFKEFYTYLNIIKDDFVDLCVVNGQFRSRTNCKTSIFETFFEYFKGMDFIIGDIRSLVRILSVLSKKTKITVTVDDENVYFNDGYQNIKIGRAPSKYCGNPFVAENELNDMILKNIDSNKPLIKYSLPKSLVCNFKKMAYEINVKTIKFMHSEDDLSKGCFVISSGHAREYKHELKKDLLTPMDKDHYFNFSTLPYIFNKSDMTLDVSFSVNQDILIIIHHTKIDKLSITIYGRASYVKPDDE